MLTIPNHKKKEAYYEMSHRASNLDGYFGTTETTENGYEIWNMEC
jgi:hypothetical protein